MTGKHEEIRKRRYATDCSGCGARISALIKSGGREPGEWVHCYCGTVNWATEPAERRPDRGVPIPENPKRVARFKKDARLTA